MKKNLLLIATAVFISLASIAQTNVSGTLSNNATWTAAGSPYTVTGNITVNAGVTLTIETGTVVQFNSGTYIVVYGTLNATSATFTANGSTSPGFWQGLFIGYEWGTDYGTVTLNGCTVEYANSLYVRMGNLTLTGNSILQNFNASGIDIYTAGSVSVENTTIHNCTYPVSFRGDGYWDVVTGVDFTGNSNDFVFINFRDINSLFNCPDAGVPYYYDSELRVNAGGTLIMDPGVEFLGNTNAYINVYGKIKALGTVSDTISFSKLPGQSFWRGINIYDSAVDTACIFDYCKFTESSYNSYNNGYYTVNIDKSSPVFNNCVWKGNHFNLGITGRSMPVFNSCDFGPSTVVVHLFKNISLDLNAEPQFNNCDISFNEQEGRAIRILGSTIYTDSHLSHISFNGLDSISYALDGVLFIADTASLIVDPGIVIKCTHPNNYIDARGRLEGIGTPSDSIIFTYISDDNYGNPADTYNDGTVSIGHTVSSTIYIRGPVQSHLKYWKVLYGGRTSDYWGWAVQVAKNSIFENSTVMNSYRGVLFWDDAQILNNTFENIDYYAVGRRMNSGTPTLLGNTINSVGNNGILLYDFLLGDYAIGGLDFAGNSNVAYIIPDRNNEIRDGTNVTILPGTNFKFDGYWSSAIIVNGGLKAEGTKTQKIVFTSIYDNSVSGNTNNNNGTDPVTRKWDRIYFTNSSNDTFNSLKNVEIRYFRESLGIDNCNVAIDSTLLNFSDSYGISIYGNAAPVITNSEFNNINNAPVEMDMFSAPVFSGNSMANVARAGLGIRGGTIAGTIPVRNFAGHNNITYLMDGNLRVDGELIIPAGVVFKSYNTDRYFDVYGRITVQGQADSPVVFTSINDDAYGNPSDTENNGNTNVNHYGPRIIFRESASDSSSVDNAVFAYSYYHGIHMNNASPSISNSIFRRNHYDAIVLRGTSTPSVTNCTFEDVPSAMIIDPMSFPATVSGNQLTGSTPKAIHIVDNATLTEDATLSKHDFAGITNIPYLFNRYTIGTSAVLTIEPGVVCKFKQNGWLNVRKGLIAMGGSTVDSTIVFTSDRDDFYGGDTYGDGDSNVANQYWWYGINFPGESIDASCILDNCVIKNATRSYSNSPNTNNRGAITVDNASPTITNCRFEDDKWGILVRNTSLPVIDNCDFIGMDPTYGYGVWNETGTVTVVAENCWWDDDTGPANPASNPDGQGVRVSDNVDFDPWITQPSQPIMGDVSLNGEVMSYDASLVLQSSVGNITLDSKQQSVADVSFNGSITSYDASLILQYTIGLIPSFEPPAGSAQLKSTGKLPEVSVSVPVTQIKPETTDFELPVTFTTGEGVKSMDIEITSDPAHIKFIGLNNEDFSQDIMTVSGYDEATGKIRISLASAYDLDLSGNSLSLVFEFTDSDITKSYVELVSLSANETPVTDEDFIVSIESSLVATRINKEFLEDNIRVYSNDRLCYADIELLTPQSKLIIAVYDLTGQLTNEITEVSHVFKQPLKAAFLLGSQVLFLFYCFSLY